MIPARTLEHHGARLVRYRRDEIIVEQGSHARDFLIVESGRVKMASFNDDGREFVQGYFSEGQSFGEPPFFNQMPYPATAIAVVDSAIWRCPQEGFIELLGENFEIHLRLTQVLSGRLMYKSMMLAEIAVEEAAHRLRTLIDYFAREAGAAQQPDFRVPYTRQQLADMTGLRVETVIRSIKEMEHEGKLRIEDGKIIWRRTTRDNTREE